MYKTKKIRNLYAGITSFSKLLGKTIISVKGLEKESKEIIFICSDDAEFYMTHIQECCEEVKLIDFEGDIQDIINFPILKAEESIDASNSREMNDASNSGEMKDFESCTWTFYHLATVKGYLTLRWLGDSNGYYSETVDFCLMGKEDI